MLFAVICLDKADSHDLRAATRPSHLDYMRSAGDRIRFAGPMAISGEDSRAGGTLVVLDAASHEAVKMFVRNDPYHQAGLFESVTIRPWTAGMGSWLPDA